MRRVLFKWPIFLHKREVYSLNYLPIECYTEWTSTGDATKPTVTQRPIFAKIRLRKVWLCLFAGSTPREWLLASLAIICLNGYPLDLMSGIYATKDSSKLAWNTKYLYKSCIFTRSRKRDIKIVDRRHTQLTTVKSEMTIKLTKQKHINTGGYHAATSKSKSKP